MSVRYDSCQLDLTHIVRDVWHGRCMSVRHDSWPSEMSRIILTCLRRDISEEGHKTLDILLRHDSCPSWDMTRVLRETWLVSFVRHDSCPSEMSGHESCFSCRDISEGHESCLRRICNVLCPSSEMSFLRHVRITWDISEGHESCLTDMHLLEVTRHFSCPSDMTHTFHDVWNSRHDSYVMTHIFTFHDVCNTQHDTYLSGMTHVNHNSCRSWHVRMTWVVRDTCRVRRMSVRHVT